MSKMWLSASIFFFLVLGAQCQSFIEILQNSSLLLTPKCEQQLGEYLANLSLNESSWALQMLDATSKIPSGILSLNFGEMGDFDQCINVKTTTNTGIILGKYCLGFISINEKNDQKQLETGSLGDLDGVKITQVMPTWALCLPNGCSTNDINAIGNALFSSVFGQQIGITFTDSLCQTINEVKPDLTSGAIVTIVVLVLLAALVLVSTICDIYYVFYGHRTCPLILKGFSAYSNGQKIFKMTASTPDQLPCLNGLKFISMMWVVAGHQYSIPMNGSITNTKQLMEWANSLYSMFLVSGTLSVDTFFTIGGTLMMYGFMKAKHKKVPFNLFLYYLHRYLRLTAPFALVVLVSATLLKYLGSGPKWPFLELYFQKNCQNYWWSALLYVQNYVNISEMCVGQTWYLNIDMQLYVVSPLVFFALWKYPRICLPFLSLCVLALTGVGFYEAWDNELPAILSNFYGNSNDYQTKYYLLTHTRSGPWVIGMVLGYFIFKIKHNEISLRPNKVVVFVSWGVCLGTLLACVLGGHSTLRGKEYDKWGNAIHIALVRPIWSLAISWIILACTTCHGGPINWFLSLPIYQVLNRFTYSIYLTHVTLLYVIAYGKKWPDYFGDFNMAYEFWGTLWVSTGLSVLLVLMTESPIIIIEKIIFGNVGKKKQPKQDLEKGVDNAAFEK
nr:PREDICTED: nose resistant to fluoxetine protein 6-like [Tribolium castaneum]|eukprot:XP_008192685.2 PREDICTED: nose resistant to fluoxetine protein 6-like [Tribolium castaneum]